MRRLSFALALAALLALILSAQAEAEFGLKELDVGFTNADGTQLIQAGAHPFAMTTNLAVNTKESEALGIEVPDGEVRDLRIFQIPGLVGDPTAVPRCTSVDFITNHQGESGCARSAMLGKAQVVVGDPETSVTSSVYNLFPPPGVAAKIGFVVLGVPVTVNLGVNESPPYNVVAGLDYIYNITSFYSSRVTLWGVPADPVHDKERGGPANIVPTPFLTVPRACQGPLATTFEADSWQTPGAFFTESILTHDGDGEPLGFTDCAKLGIAPSVTAQPTSKAASSPTGLDFSLNVSDEGLKNPEGIAASDIEKVEVTLPEGMSANPSLAEGLNVCTEADLERETAFSEAGAGCPNASKIGTVEVETPLLEENINGALFIAKPYENPFNSLLALYIVIKSPELGIKVVQPAKVIPDPVTGQLRTITEEMPQLPFSHFRLHFKEGVRSPLTTPQACGTYNATATFYPWAGGSPVTLTPAFEIISGPNKAPCPSGGLPPFKPGLVAGTLNNRAGSFSPFYLRLFRSDAEQEITHFSIKLPPGITGKLAGIPYCPDAAIEAAKARTGPHGGAEELASPSCPKASEIGRTLAGAGVGPALTYAPGKVYLAGPYHGSPLSMVAITAGVVGPFDIGTVVVREAFKINPETAEVFIDSTGSDPIPHIILGIPVHLRDIRAYVDRPEFVLNPTDCTPTSTASTVLGAGLDFVSEADDNPITVSSRFQAADCAALSFAPQLTMRLIGGTRRGAHPKLTSHLAMNGIGEAGIDHATVLLPRSEFIENAHFNTICTRVQFKEGAGNGAACPAGSIYGHARAVTPILSEPLEGPVFLRSNPERQLPDVVAALHNAQVDFDLVGNVDSVKGRLRTTFAGAPDAPVSSFDLELEGGAKGLFVNSTNLCKEKHRAVVAFGGQNGKAFTVKPLMRVKCKGKARHRRAARRHKRAAR